MTKGPRIGVFGGTFDPIHQAHVDVAAAAMRQVPLDQVLFMVSAMPPHKQGEVNASAEDRVAMVEAALASYPQFRCSRLELDRDGPSYTADTLRELQEAQPAAQLYLIIGYDAMLDLPRWREPNAILKRAHIVVVPRLGYVQDVPHELRGRITFLEFEPIELSSTDVRECLVQGDCGARWVPPAVLQVIRDRHLYATR